MKKSTEHRAVNIILTLSVLLLAIILGSFYVEQRNKTLEERKDIQNQEELVLNIASNASRRGNTTDGIHVIEFGDFTCVNCREFKQVIDDVLEKYSDNIQHIWFHAFSQENETALTAAKASECAKQQGKFWEYHDLLLVQSELPIAIINQMADEISLDKQLFQTCLQQPRTTETVLDHLTFSEINGVIETPTILIDDQRFEGLVTFEQIDAYLTTKVSQN